MSFDRWESKDKHSYAFRIFSKYHTYMNSLYWAHVPASQNVQYQCRQALKLPNVPTTGEYFNLKGPNAFRVSDSIDSYSEHLKEFDNWTRLNTLVSVLSYFEIYLSSVLSLSIESDVGLLHSVPRQIDGAIVLKYNNGESHSFFDKSESVTKGDWHQRINNFLSIFKLAPISFEKNISDLEKMRKIRNNVAHAFGRDINDSRSRYTLEVLPIERLSERRLIRYMELVRNVAKEIDNQLLKNHIGEYELVHYYHSIQKKLNSKNKVKDLKSRINGLYVKNRSVDYCRQLIAYYESL